MRAWLLASGIAFAGVATIAAAQVPTTRDTLLAEPMVPARLILGVRDDLQLSDVQVSRLKTLAKAQIASLSRSTAAYFRADADLLDVSQRDDVAAHRLALEKRAKIAIDAEVARWQANKDSRAVLTADQRARFAGLDVPKELGATVSAWQHIVEPPVLLRRPLTAEVLDSGEVRLAVLPNYADIYVDGLKVGIGRKFQKVPVGEHTLMFHAAGCTDIIVTITVDKGPAQIVPLQKLICSQ